MLLKRLLHISLLAILLLAAYFFHISLYKSAIDNSVYTLINFSYVFNFLFTTTSLLITLVFFKKLKKQAGYIFLFLSTVKILLFLIGNKIFNFTLEKSDFLHFFIPFFICLFFEVFYLSRIFNRLDFTDNA
tara:strand:+ start:305 stop:697 length:393 start_codon:yes stop_codon:yes gene_type:complete